MLERRFWSRSAKGVIRVVLAARPRLPVFPDKQTLFGSIACLERANNGLLRRNEGKRPASGLLRSSEQNWTSIIWERGHTGIMASERKVLARQEFSCTSRAR